MEKPTKYINYTQLFIQVLEHQLQDKDPRLYSKMVQKFSSPATWSRFSRGVSSIGLDNAIEICHFCDIEFKTVFTEVEKLSQTLLESEKIKTANIKNKDHIPEHDIVTREALAFLIDRAINRNPSRSQNKQNFKPE